MVTCEPPTPKVCCHAQFKTVVKMSIYGCQINNGKTCSLEF
uniref:Uncharacterized protein n=1 Tax=Anguilla anguilla TaxID=7936 RepID=A0A0E9TN72_ANGAN